MEVRIKPDTESQLNEVAAKSGRPVEELVADVLAAYCTEAAEVRTMLDGRYDDIKTGRLKPMDGEAAFGRLRNKSNRCQPA